MKKPNRIKDITGKRFGKLVAIKFIRRERHHTFWKCSCKCGNMCEAISNSLQNGTTISCGCSKIAALKGKRFGKWHVKQFVYIKNRKSYWLCQCKCGNQKIISRAWICMNKIFCEKCDESKGFVENLYGRRFGHIQVISKSPIKKNNAIYWVCRCDCGKQKEIRSDHLKGGKIKSCGCCKLIAEGELYDIIKNIFKGCDVIRHYSDDKLGKQHIDIAVIRKGKILCAIEYDGKQHFVPINFGNMNKKQVIKKFKRQKILDKRKNKILAENDIDLIRFNFMEEINKNAVIFKLKEASVI